MKNTLIWLWMLGSIVSSWQEALKEFTRVELKDCLCIVENADQLDAPWDWPTLYQSNQEELLLIDNIQTEDSWEFYIQYKTKELKLETDVYGKGGTIYQKTLLNNEVQNNPTVRSDIQEVLCTKMKDIIKFKEEQAKASKRYKI